MERFPLSYKYVVAALFVVWLPLITGCNKLIDAGPPSNQVVTPQVYANDSLAQAALIGVYYKMMANFGPFNGFISRFAGLAADELDRGTSLEQDLPFSINLIPSDNNTIWFIWTNTYAYIYQCNDLIEGLTKTNPITPALRNQLLGEACFLRALSYFYLINLYGDVPLVLTTDYTKSANIPRTSMDAVYDQIEKDLMNAQDLLPNAYVTTPAYPTARVRVNRLAVKALLARVYLYRGRWADAITASTAVIESGIYQLETNLSQTFLYNSKEAILQFMPVMDIYNTAEGGMFIPMVPTSRPAIILSDTLMQKIGPGDARRSWIRTVPISGKEYNSPYKYKNNTGTPRDEYNMVLRLAEQYCIRAEARAMLNQLPEAVNDLNIIRQRAGLQDLTNIVSQAQVLAAIEQERRVEFFAEWGHRWFDLKRWTALTASHPREKRVDEVMRVFRPATWKPTAALWPIPSIEFARNPALIQNPGYD